MTSISCWVLDARLDRSRESAPRLSRDRPCVLRRPFGCVEQRTYVVRNRNHGEDDAEKREKPPAGSGFGLAWSRIPLCRIRAMMGTLRIRGSH